MSDEEFATTGEQFTSLIKKGIEEISKRGLDATKINFKETCQKILSPQIPKFSQISPRSNRKKKKHLQSSFEFGYSDEKMEAAIKSVGTGNLVNWLDHGHVYHTKKGDKFWQGKLTGKFSALKKETDDAFVAEFEKNFEKS